MLSREEIIKEILEAEENQSDAFDKNLIAEFHLASGASWAFRKVIKMSLKELMELKEKEVLKDESK